MDPGHASPSQGPGLGTSVKSDENNWLVVGLALNKVVVPELRSFVEDAVKELYGHLSGPPHFIVGQTFGTHLTHHPSTTSQVPPLPGPKLQYGNINSNKPTEEEKKRGAVERQKQSWDYKVNTEIDLAKLFMQPYMAKCNSFPECDSSALLGLIKTIDDSMAKDKFKAIRPEAEEVQKIRNKWAHCSFKQWDDAHFQEAFKSMENLLKSLKATQEVQNSLDKWKKDELRLCTQQEVQLYMLLQRKEADIVCLIEKIESEMHHKTEVLQDKFEALQAELQTLREQMQAKLGEDGPLSDEAGRRVWPRHGILGRMASWAAWTMLAAWSAVMAVNSEQQRCVRDLKERLRKLIDDEVSQTKLKDIGHFTTLFIQVGEYEGQMEGRRAYNELQSATSSDTKKKIEYHQIFDVNCDVSNTKQPTSTKKPKTVLIIGRPGMGKTTLIRKVVSQWSQDLLWLDRFQYLFHFQLRYYNSNDMPSELSCRELLMDHLSCGHNDTQKPHIWHDVTNNPEKVLIVFDGLDEFRGFDGKKKTDMFPTDDSERKLKLYILLGNLQSQKLMRGASVIFTSRPGTSASALFAPFDITLGMPGFNEEQIKMFAKTSSKDDDESSWVIGFLDNHVDLRSYCQIPGLCALICHTAKCIREHQDSAEGKSWESNPRTITELMTVLIKLFIMDHHPDYKDDKTILLNQFPDPLKESLKRLAALAAWGMTSDPIRLTFSLSSIPKEITTSITQADRNMGLITSSKGPSHFVYGISEDVWAFLHLLVMEFLAALHLAAQKWKEVQAKVTNFEKREYDMLRLFMLGALVDPALQESLRDVFTLPPPEECKVRAIQMLEAMRSSKMADSKEGKLFMLMSLYQTQNPEMLKAMGRCVLDDNGALNLSNSQVTAVECGAIGYFLEYTDTPLVNLHLYGNPLGPEGARQLCAGLKQNMNSLEILHLQSTQLGDSGLEALVDVLQEAGRLRMLVLTGNHLSPRGVAVLSHKLKADRLERLFLNHNPELCDEGARHLAVSLLPRCTQLQELWLYNTGLTDEGALCVAEALSTHCPRLGKPSDYKGLWLGYGDPLSPECKARLEEMLPGRVLFV